jgi:uncharacterized protein (DUF2252 family)
MTNDLHHHHHAKATLPIAGRMAWGKSLRAKTPRSVHALWEPAADRPDPVQLLDETNQGRLPDLVPIRHGRMLQSPFTFLRGSAAAMARDLAPTPTTGLTVQLCGDCHLLNFGIFGTPERNLIFDVNDFDETLPGPWEWDVKRLAASFFVAGRSNRLSERRCLDVAEAVVRSYRQHMIEYSRMGVLDVWYAHLDSRLLINLAGNREDRRRRQQENARALTQTTARIFPKMTEVADGHRRIVDHPPRIFHLPAGDPLEQEMYAALKNYPDTLQDDRHFQLSRFKVVDLALKVVGVGSVGTRCGVFLLLAGENDPLVLQIKEARASVLEPFVGKSKYQNQGRRVVTGQRLLQATSDIFLGWADHGAAHNYYFRQLRDSKGGVEVEGMTSSGLSDYAEACGWALARGHAKSGDAAAIAGYLGGADTFDIGIAAFAARYADQTERDHAAMVEAVRAGRLVAAIEKPTKDPPLAALRSPNEIIPA